MQVVVRARTSPRRGRAGSGSGRPSNGGGVRGHLAVGGDHRRLAVAVAPAAVGVLDEEPLQVARRRDPVDALREQALVEAPLDTLLERGVRPVARGRPRPRAARSRGRSGSRGRGARGARRARDGGRRARTRAGRRTSARSRRPARCRPPRRSRSTCSRDAPRRLVRRRAVAEQVGREHVVVARASPPRAASQAAAVPGDAVEADDPRRVGITPRLDVERAAHGLLVERFERLRHHLRALLVLDERPDHDARPCRSGTCRARGAPVSSSKTPYARAAAPCCQKSEANA